MTLNIDYNMEYEATIQEVNVPDATGFVSGFVGVIVKFDDDDKEGFIIEPFLKLKKKQRNKLLQGFVPGNLRPGSKIKVKLLRSSNGYNDLTMV
jgi:hypothetical protein